MVEDKSDTMVIAKTGAGKTLVYVMVALLSRRMVVVFEPLLALIKDQVRAITEFKSGLKVKGLTAEEESSTVVRCALANDIDIC